MGLAVGSEASECSLNSDDSLHGAVEGIELPLEGRRIRSLLLLVALVQLIKLSLVSNVRGLRHARLCVCVCVLCVSCS